MLNNLFYELGSRSPANLQWRLPFFCGYGCDCGCHSGLAALTVLNFFLISLHIASLLSLLILLFAKDFELVVGCEAVAASAS